MSIPYLILFILVCVCTIAIGGVLGYVFPPLIGMPLSFIQGSLCGRFVWRPILNRAVRS